MNKKIAYAAFPEAEGKPEKVQEIMGIKIRSQAGGFYAYTEDGENAWDVSEEDAILKLALRMLDKPDQEAQS